MAVASGQWWDSDTLIGWSTLLVGVAAIAVSVVLYRRSRRPEPRSELVQLCSVVRLLARHLGDQDAGKLKIIYMDRVLRNPHLIRLLVESRSEKDIPSTRFDSRKPLVFNLKVPIVAALGSPSGSAVDENCLGINAGRVEIAPYLIRKGRILDIEVLTDDYPYLVIDSPLIEVDIHRLGTDDNQTAQMRHKANFFSMDTLLWSIGVVFAIGGLFIILEAATH